MKKGTILFLVAILAVTLVFQVIPADALKSQGTSNPGYGSTTNICGYSICGASLTVQERIAQFLQYGYDGPQSNAFSFGGILDDTPTLTVTTSKSEYNFGERVKISGTLDTGERSRITISALNSDDPPRQVFSDSKRIRDDGTFNKNIRSANLIEPGIFTVTVTFDNELSESVTFGYGIELTDEPTPAEPTPAEPTPAEPTPAEPIETELESVQILSATSDKPMYNFGQSARLVGTLSLDDTQDVEIEFEISDSDGNQIKSATKKPINSDGTFNIGVGKFFSEPDNYTVKVSYLSHTAIVYFAYGVEPESALTEPIPVEPIETEPTFYVTTDAESYDFSVETFEISGYLPPDERIVIEIKHQDKARYHFDSSDRTDSNGFFKEVIDDRFRVEDVDADRGEYGRDVLYTFGTYVVHVYSTESDTSASTTFSFPLGDVDDDGILDNVDNCPFDSNPSQLNTDFIQEYSLIYGDACDDDDDNDGLSDIQEIDKYGTEPLEPDTDGDRVWDGYEVRNGLNPLVADSDGDGIDDYAEYESNRAVSAEAAAAEAARDDDGDGVQNGSDSCQDTVMPAKVNENGCELPDSDGDGYYDVADVCPSEPENFNNILDKDGCPDYTMIVPQSSYDVTDTMLVTITDTEGITDNVPIKFTFDVPTFSFIDGMSTDTKTRYSELIKSSDGTHSTTFDLCRIVAPYTLGTITVTVPIGQQQLAETVSFSKSIPSSLSDGTLGFGHSYYSNLGNLALTTTDSLISNNGVILKGCSGEKQLTFSANTIEINDGYDIASAPETGGSLTSKANDFAGLHAGFVTAEFNGKMVQTAVDDFTIPTSKIDLHEQYHKLEIFDDSARVFQIRVVNEDLDQPWWKEAAGWLAGQAFDYAFNSNPGTAAMNLVIGSQMHDTDANSVGGMLTKSLGERDYVTVVVFTEKNPVYTIVVLDKITDKKFESGRLNISDFTTDEDDTIIAVYQGGQYAVAIPTTCYPFCS